jgi:hypothetical protein
VIDYNTHLNSEWYRQLRFERRQLAGDLCENCQLAFGTECHHLTYERFGHELLEDLVWVCDSCHEVLDTMRRHKETVIIPNKKVFVLVPERNKRKRKSKRERQYMKQINLEIALSRLGTTHAA